MTPFNNNPESSRDFTTLKRSPYAKQRKNDVCIPASTADAAAISPKGINTLLANCVITFFVNGNPVFNKGPRNLPKNSPDYISFDNRVFENLISTNELLANALRILETCLPVNNSCGKLAISLESPIMLGDNLITTSV